MIHRGGPSTDAMARGFPQSQQSIHNSADGDAIYQRFITLFQSFCQFGFVIKTTFHRFLLQAFSALESIFHASERLPVKVHASLFSLLSIKYN